MKARRVLLTTDAVGGVWTYALDLAGALARTGTGVVLMTMGPRPSVQQRATATAIAGLALVESDAPLDWLARDEAAVRAAARAIASTAKEHEVDLVHLHAPALAVADFAVPVVAVAHSCLATWWDAVEGTSLPPAFAWRDALTREGLLGADAVVAPSRAFAEALCRVHHLPFLPFAVHNGRTDTALPARSTVDHAFTAGRLWDRGKDLATLDHAAATGVPIHAAGPLAGPDGDRFAPDHLACLGPLGADALRVSLAGRPVFVSAALYEPFGLAVLEAAQAGCALVLADIPTFRELWDGAATFVRPRDAAGFAEAIAALLADPGRRAAEGRSAAIRSETYTVDAMHAATVSLHDRLCASPERVAA